MFKRRWMLGIAATATVTALALGAIAAGAQTQEGDGTSFLDRVAARLGIGSSELEQAIKDTRAGDIDQAVADGKLTQERADELKQRLDELPLDGPGWGFGHGKGFGMELRGGPDHDKFGLAGPGFAMGEAKQKLAGFLGITTDELRTELRADGATLATVAEAHGKSRDELKTFIREDAEARLTQAVTDAGLTQERADAVLARLDEHLDTMIDHGLPGGPGFRHFRGGTPAPGAPPEGGTEESGQQFDLSAPIRRS